MLHGSASALCRRPVPAYARARQRVAAASWMPCAGWHGWALPGASCRLRTEMELGLSPLGPRVRPRRMAAPPCRLIRICPPCSWTARSDARTSARRACPSATGHQGCHAGPGSAHEPPAPRPGAVPGAQRRGTGPRLAQGRRRVATRYDKYAHRCLGFLVPGGGRDLAEIPHPHGLSTLEKDIAYSRQTLHTFRERWLNMHGHSCPQWTPCPAGTLRQTNASRGPIRSSLFPYLKKTLIRMARQEPLQFLGRKTLRSSRKGSELTE